MTQYFGKYRALVSETNSNTKQIKVKCPTIFGNYTSAWCNPCFPSLQDSSLIKMPSIDDPVWIEFEQGDLSKPLWVGTWRL